MHLQLNLIGLDVKLSFQIEHSIVVTIVVVVHVASTFIEILCANFGKIAEKGNTLKIEMYVYFLILGIEKLHFTFYHLRSPLLISNQLWYAFL